MSGHQTGAATIEAIVALPVFVLLLVSIPVLDRTFGSGLRLHRAAFRAALVDSQASDCSNLDLQEAFQSIPSAVTSLLPSWTGGLMGWARTEALESASFELPRLLSSEPTMRVLSQSATLTCSPARSPATEAASGDLWVSDIVGPVF